MYQILRYWCIIVKKNLLFLQENWVRLEKKQLELLDRKRQLKWEVENIFQKFYQVEESFTGQIGGWGLGLALVKKATELHGGRVFAKSQLQKGSAFTIVLPK